jgi:hypothetical protein
MCLGNIVVILQQKTTYRQKKTLVFFKVLQVLHDFFESKEHKKYIITFGNKIHFFGVDK